MTSTAAPSVSLVILNWNGGQLLRRAVRAAVDQEGIDTEVIVVDNGSTDGSLESLGDLTDAVRIERLGTNTGFAVGMNSGIDIARGDLIAPLNCDVVVTPDFAANAAAVFARRADMGTLAPLVWRDQDPTAGTEPPLDAGPVDLTVRMTVVVDPVVEQERTCFKPNGACPVYRRSALADVSRPTGYVFDPAFHTYGEDIDLAFRLWRAGWTTWFDPSVQATHVRSYASAPRLLDKPPALRRNILAGQWRNAARHVPRGHRLTSYVHVAVAHAVLAVASLLSRRWRAAGDVGVAWTRFLRELPTQRAFREAHGTVSRDVYRSFLRRPSTRDQLARTGILPRRAA